jgi:hypothetical protein
MKMLIKSNKGYSNIPPLQNIIQDEGLEEVVYGGYITISFIRFN